jgi:hypothetical protein
MFPDPPGPGPAGGSALARLVAVRVTEGLPAFERELPGVQATVPERFFPLDWTVSDHVAGQGVY